MIVLLMIPVLHTPHMQSLLSIFSTRLCSFVGINGAVAGNVRYLVEK